MHAENSYRRSMSNRMRSYSWIGWACPSHLIGSCTYQEQAKYYCGYHLWVKIHCKGYRVLVKGSLA